MKVIELPTKAFDGNTDEMEQYQDLGLAVESNLVDVTMVVNVEHITAFNKDSEGNTTLYLTGDPMPFTIEMTFEEFKQKLRHACKYGDL